MAANETQCYYGVLGVCPSASMEEIGEAYHLKVLAIAYQVLSDFVQGDLHNQNGECNISRKNMIDPTPVNAFLFESEIFEEYIGHPAVGSMVSSDLASETDNPEKLHDKLKAKQVHPEKRPNYSFPAEKFQVLTDAYHVLIDPVQRDAYDRNEGYNIYRENLVDPTEVFEDYSGHITIGSMAFSEPASKPDNPENLHFKLKAGILQIAESVVRTLSERSRVDLEHDWDMLDNPLQIFLVRTLLTSLYFSDFHHTSGVLLAEIAALTGESAVREKVLSGVKKLLTCKEQVSITGGLISLKHPSHLSRCCPSFVLYKFFPDCFPIVHKLLGKNAAAAAAAKELIN